MKDNRKTMGMNDKTEPLIRTYDYYIEVSELEPVHDESSLIRQASSFRRSSLKLSMMCLLIVDYL